MRYYGSHLGYFAPSVSKINYPTLIKKHHIKAVLFDLDNTLLPHGGRAHSRRVKRLFRYLQGLGIEVWQGSNNPVDRKEELLQIGDESLMHYQSTDGLLDLFLRRKGKPNPEFFLEMCRTRNIEPQYVLAIGDNFLRDTVGALSVGMTTVTVDRQHEDAIIDLILRTRYFESQYLRDQGILRIDGQFIRFDPGIASPAY